MNVSCSLPYFNVLGRAHLREALVVYEECQRQHRMCRELKGKQALTSVLRNAHKTALNSYTGTETDDFLELLDPPLIRGRLLNQVTFFYCNRARDNGSNMKSIHQI